MVELVIKISEEDYEYIKNSDDMNFNAIKNGTPLPEEHGDLIDRDEFHKTLENMPIRDNDKWFNWLQKACLRLAEAPTIVEADKEIKE